MKKKSIRKSYKGLFRITVILAAFLLVTTFAGTMKSFAGSERPSDEELSKYYTSVMVYPGDSLETLTEEYMSEGYDDPASLAKEILSINHLSPDKALQPGNHIIVPVYR